MTWCQILDAAATARGVPAGTALQQLLLQALNHPRLLRGLPRTVSHSPSLVTWLNRLRLVRPAKQQQVVVVVGQGPAGGLLRSSGSRRQQQWRTSRGRARRLLLLLVLVVCQQGVSSSSSSRT